MSASLTELGDQRNAGRIRIVIRAQVLATPGLD